MDRQNACKGQAAEALEDGDKAGALAKLTEAILIANAALGKNPDSAKAYRLRAKAHRFLSMWDEAVTDFAACQKIDYDDDLKDMHEFCNRRKKWHAKKKAQEAKKDA